LANSGRQALTDARSALSLDGDNASAYYLGAAAYARMDDYADATATLHNLLAREPHNFVTWALLGDLAVRRADYAVARTAYGRAAQLNPLDPTLHALARAASEASAR
jgi:cytochrome c-type biogenesis protein CcmH/NrfG